MWNVIFWRYHGPPKNIFICILMLEDLFAIWLNDLHTSGIGFDQALEKCYTYTAKAVGGIIGITRQQESRTLWDLIKHEKEAYLSFLHKSVGCEGNKFGELNSLHHEFNQRSAKVSNERVFLLVDYLRSIKSTFSSSMGEKMVNVVTKEEIYQSEFYLNFTLLGRYQRLRFIK